MKQTISKEFIDNQKKRMVEEKEKALHQVEAIKKNDPFLDPERVVDNAAVDTEVREQESHQVIEAKVHDLEKKITDIDRAIAKIAKKRYGYCEKCNEQILIARLKLLPEARYCVKCESKLRQ